MRCVWRWVSATVVVGCGNGLVPSPFAGPADRDAGAATSDAATADPEDGTPPPLGSSVVGEVLGGPCIDDAQCDDGIECTFGACDAALGLCRFIADDARCLDATFCNGLERCDARLGCRPGPPTSCSDLTPCTIDSCDEQAQACVRVERDVDGDGDVDANCQLDGDCNDLDPLVSSLAPELCGNGVDDDCDETTDEAECQTPEFDSCADGLVLSAAGSYVVSPAGTQLDYGASCASQALGARELVAFVTVPAGPAQDVNIVARSAFGALALARVESCGVALNELECLDGVQLPSGESVARLYLRSLAPGVHVIYLFTTSSAPIQLDVDLDAATVAPTNLSCQTRLPIEPGQPVQADLSISGSALASACPTARGDLLYEFSLTEPADVLAFAESLDGLGQPRLSLRQDACEDESAELRCNQAALASLRVRALGPGTYVLAVSASGPSVIQTSLELRPPSTPPSTDQCETAPSLVANQTEAVSFVDLVDDIAAGCGTPGAIDTARRLDLAAPSDVLLIGRFSTPDNGSVALANPGCGLQDVLRCTQVATGTARASVRDLPAGQYRVVAESRLGLPATLTAAVRPARPPTLVPLAEGCASALLIPAGGGFFQGSTVNAAEDFSASCDFATPAGAPDQLLRLVLEQPRRLILDMRGSDFETLLNVRRGPTCPGEEVPAGCSVTSGPDRSFLDLSLSAGEYFVQIDGYAGASGTWFLNVFVMDP
jgi:hypothetical protein